MVKSIVIIIFVINVRSRSFKSCNPVRFKTLAFDDTTKPKSKSKVFGSVIAVHSKLLNFNFF